jgi:peptide/nickel transport system ATP-binding protein/oligopeptide transport system ATP-binding protein
VTTTSVPPTSSKLAGEALLQVDGLTKYFPIKRGLLQRQVGAVQAVDGLTFDVTRGETLSLVGESGCGKTTTGRMLTRLLEPTDGKILLEGHDITHWSTGKMRPLRRDVQMIFQDPYGSLNPRHTVGTIVGAPYRLQGIKTEKGVKATVQELLELVGLNPEHYNRYPHEFSGGQRQRIGIARSLALKPKLIVADEPVSALDVSIQAQVINLLEDLQDEMGLTYVVIAHDLSVVRHMSDRVAVMYLGKLVEIADRDDLYTRPMHPYTTALLSAVPIPDTQRRTKRERIRLEGDVPSPINPPPACRFHTRCWKMQEICRTQEPPLVALAPGHQVACHFPENVEDPAATQATSRVVVSEGTASGGTASGGTASEGVASAATVQDASVPDDRVRDDATTAGPEAPAATPEEPSADTQPGTGSTPDA